MPKFTVSECQNIYVGFLGEYGNLGLQVERTEVNLLGYSKLELYFQIIKKVTTDLQVTYYDGTLVNMFRPRRETKRGEV